jgi:hypothetical protein
MPDPHDALQSFQHFLRLGRIWPQRVPLDLNLYVHRDQANGGDRITYVTLDAKTVTAFVCFVPRGPVEAMPCFTVGYAVPQACRNQGRAKQIVAAALAEMQRGLGRNGVPIFYVEAIVGAENKMAQRIAERTISGAPVAMTDEISGLPALRYVRKMGMGL